MKKALMFLVSIFLLISIFSQFSSAVLSWSNFGGEYTGLSQAQFGSIKSRFDTSAIVITNLAQGNSFNVSRIAYQPLVATSIQDQNILVLQNGNYLQAYDKNLNLLQEKLTGSAEGQLSVCDFDGGGIKNDVAGFYAKNSTTIIFKVFNISSDYSINTILEKNITLGNITTNGLRCKTGECYAFISEKTNSTTYLQYLQILTYNATSSNVDLITYSFAWGEAPIYEPPAYIDWDSDGTTEFLGFSNQTTYVVDYNGNPELTYNNPFQPMVSAKFIKADAGNYRIAMATNFPDVSCGYNHISIRVIRADKTTIWHNQICSSNSGDTYRIGGMAVEDYNGDGYQDIFFSQFKTGSNQETRFRVYRGSDGADLYNVAYAPAFSTGYNYPEYSLSIAKMGVDDTYDFVGSRGNAVYIFDTSNNTMAYTDSSSFTSCISADLTYDNLLDVVCSSFSATRLYTSNYTNQNAYLTSLTYDPATTISLSDTLYAYIYATDPEGDSPLYYSIKCGNSASWKSDTTSNAQNCVFNLTGTYNVSVRVRDFFHSTYNYFSQDILVTTIGSICDNDDICEISQGETYITCPHDCPAPSENYIQAEGGMALPTELVSTENYNQGLLPEIYYSMLAFFSRSLLPLIVVVTGIFIALIIFAFAGIITKLMNKA